MFSFLQSFVQELISNSMLLLIVIAVPIAAGAVTFYILAREPAPPEVTGWIGRLTRRRRRIPRAGSARRRREAPPALGPAIGVAGVGEIATGRVEGRRVEFVKVATDAVGIGAVGIGAVGIGAAARMPASQVIFVDPLIDEDGDELYELDDIESEADVEVEEGRESV